MTTTYRPINCNYYDVLLDLATRRIEANVLITDEQGQKEISGIIKDVFTRSGEEFALVGEQEIRLDKILSVNGIVSEGFCEWK